MQSPINKKMHYHKHNHHKNNHDNGLSKHNHHHHLKSLRRKADRLLAERKSLPVYNNQDEILQAFYKYHTLIIVGETGSGKTTQIPQFLENKASLKSAIAITQPRRVAAVSVAQRVSEEVGCKLGDKVGYTIRFDDTSSVNTRIKFLTDGMLLREISMTDNDNNKDNNDNKHDDHLLMRYSVIILDEAHERSIHTDILFGLLKNIQEKRKKLSKEFHLKLIIMSATLHKEAQVFANYFGNATMLYVSGRQFPVQILYTKVPQPDYLDAVITCVLQIHLNNKLLSIQDNNERKYKSYGTDILVFMTGQEEIEQTKYLLQEKVKLFPKEIPSLHVCSLYAAQSPKLQMEALQKAPHGCRKVVLSTNIAETSITIEGVKFVIDTGVTKVRQYRAKARTDSLLVIPISKAEAWQRSGRAGRQQPGICYRLYTESSFLELKSSPVPEILRCNLSATILQLKSLGVKNINEFPFLLSPPMNSLIAAQKELILLSALSSNHELLQLGEQMSLFPLIPPLSKIVIMSCNSNYNCSEEILMIVSMMSVEVLFVNPSINDQRKIAKMKVSRSKFASKLGDHLTLLFIFQEYCRKEKDERKQWCHDHFINSRSMLKVEKIYKQLLSIVIRLNLSITSSGTDLDIVRKCLTTGLFENSACKQADGSYLTVFSKKNCYIHPSSVLSNSKPEWIIYNEMVKTTRVYIRDVTVIDFLWLREIEPQLFSKSIMN